MDDEKEEIRRDLAATVEARRELGHAYEDELVLSLCERIEATLQSRVDDRAALARGGDDESGGMQFVLGLATIGMGIPITAIATSNGGLAETLVAWAGIVGVNVAFAWRSRH